ncbi:hypothetical protein P171DRAFT_422165 [Karstenula rhodostoma CBS 690.94]|uniref:Uncharacterized protein n=1 Tax=Karstenula rhodostoma CBS 690.94 TaxID=1392251 RepID=A0A9P4U794_9PLEO|nr:hypothetical protein P171DRAFT_422165 [Karstenula rhodostoma CBS 690.94]
MSSHDDGAPSAQRYQEEICDAPLKLSVRSIPELKRAESREELASVGLLSTLENDTRASFVVEISSGIPQDGVLELLYFNCALAGAPALLAKLRGDDASQAMFLDDLQPRVAFAQWLWGQVKITDPAVIGDAYLFADHLWWATTIANGRHRVVSGVLAAFLRQEEVGHKRPHGDDRIDVRDHNEPKNMPQYLPERLRAAHGRIDTQEMVLASSFGPFDYTQDLPCQNMSDHVLYFRSIDWAATPLGSMASWSPQLRCVVNMVLNDHHHAVLFWGEEATMIYSEAYVELIDGMHPCMGQSASVVAKEFWSQLEPLIQLIKSTGKTFSNADMPLFIDRHGFLEEAFFSFQFIPVLDANGCVAGYYQPVIETTRHQLLERRITSLVEIGSGTAKARDLKTYWELAIDTIATNDRDAPFALLYAVEDFSVPTKSSLSTPGIRSEISKFVLKGSIGVEAGHYIAPPTIDLENGNNVFESHLKRSVKSMIPVVAHFADMELPEGILEGIGWKGFGDPCRSLIFCPIQLTTSEQVQGFLILGVNPRRPFDEDYKQFVHVMLRLLATSLASVVLFDEEIRQKENAIGQAAQLEKQFIAELHRKEEKFQRYADQSDVAIFVMDAVGSFTYRNQGWYELFAGVADSDDVADTCASTVWPEDIALCEDVLSKLGIQKSPICLELKTRMRWKPPGADSGPDSDPQEYYKWILCSAYPELDASNEIIEIVGNVTDISKQKWAEDVQRRRTDSALESKKHLEHFIDTTSHEMRNPLSVIMQCADEILTSYPGTDGDFAIPSPVTYAALLDQTADAAQTIAHCAQHMKRIVDDILTISKLDSGLLIITPIDAQPAVVAHHAVKMFESEAKVADVDLSFEVDKSCRNLGIDWVSLDPTRLLQILINLITNALKFSRFEPEPRRIKVTISAYEREPTNDTGGIHFEPKLVEDDSHLLEDWKQGPLVYLHFSVSDTGRGLTDDERSNLFARFSQASPRTHINYGGSGLGLFISRRLAEMQGGAIGLASEFSKGSTFSFYIKARRAKSAKLRRSSIPNIFPEDMRHRATTRREISKMNSRTESPVSEKSTNSRWPSQRTTAQSPGDDKQTNGGSQQRPPPVQRRRSTLHPNIPNDALGLPPEPDLAELKRTRGVSEDMHVLVVEDNLVNQKVLANQLRKLGCVVSVANHGGEALDFLKKTSRWRGLTLQTCEAPPAHTDPPLDLHLILMDWEMPVMDGLTAVTNIRQFERGGQLSGHMPIIGVTANVREQQIQAAMDVGMDDVVSKPFRVSELMGRMRGVVEGVGSGDVRWKGFIPEKEEGGT